MSDRHFKTDFYYYRLAQEFDKSDWWALPRDYETIRGRAAVMVLVCQNLLTRSPEHPYHFRITDLGRSWLHRGGSPYLY